MLDSGGPLLPKVLRCVLGRITTEACGRFRSSYQTICLAELEREAKARGVAKSVVVRHSLERLSANGAGRLPPRVTTWPGISPAQSRASRAILRITQKYVEGFGE